MNTDTQRVLRHTAWTWTSTCYMSVFMSMLHVHVHAVCSCASCMSVSMLHVHVILQGHVHTARITKKQNRRKKLFQTVAVSTKEPSTMNNSMNMTFVSDSFDQVSMRTQRKGFIYKKPGPKTSCYCPFKTSVINLQAISLSFPF
jgi:hypothetical protein